MKGPIVADSDVRLQLPRARELSNFWEPLHFAISGRACTDCGHVSLGSTLRIPRT